jgi:hypothetical protein
MKNRERIEKLESRLTRLEELIRPDGDVADSAEKLKTVTTACDGWFAESQRAVRQAQELGKALRVRTNEYDRLRAELAEKQRYILDIEYELLNTRGAMASQDERERAAGEKCGVLYEHHGCDWPDAVAEEVLRLHSELMQCNHMNRDLTTERDALQARVNAGTVVYGENFQGLSNFADFVKECDTHTGLLIDVQPIAADHIADAGKIDERKGERRNYKEKEVRDEESGIRYWRDLSNHLRDENRCHDRRRTAGTRADRKAGSHE